MSLQRLAKASFPVRITAFLAGLALLWFPLAAVLIWGIQDANTESIALMAWLLVAFVSGLFAWGRWLYGCPNLLQRYGLGFNSTQAREFLTGLAIGVFSLMLMVAIQTLLRWVVWVPPRSTLHFFQVALEGLLVAIAVGIGEELVFRGWLLDELERDYSPTIALWASGVTFAVLHFIKPWDEVLRTFPQFPGLVLLGLLLVWAKRACQRRLGSAIGLHAGLVWGYYLVQVGGLVRYQPSAPELWSGVDQNPLAGGLGILMMATLAGIARQMALRSQLHGQWPDKS
ncbi:MAG: type II CAAX endopeptidase family protein [Elainellaceae cyanobacterium]